MLFSINNLDEIDAMGSGRLYNALEVVSGILVWFFLSYR